MSNYLTAAQDIQALSLQYQRVIALGEFLGKLGAMENLEIEIQTRIDALKKEEADLIVGCNSQREITTNEIAHAESVRKAAEDYAAQTKRGAEAEAKSIRETAQKEADEAKHNADKYTADAERQLADANKKVLAHSKLHEELTDKIAEAKATIQKLLGK